MAEFTAREILDAAKGELICGDIGLRILGISTDSRTVSKGQLFIAIKGERFDGHDFIEDVFKKGACGVVLSSDYEGLAARYPERLIIRISDTLKALGDIANFNRARFNIPVVAITGSCGKTTTKEMIHAILSKKYNTLKNVGTENNLIGVPLTLLKLDDSHGAAVVELGMNHFGEIRRLTEIISPTIGVITNIAEAHLECLRDLDGVLKAKLELLEHIEDNGIILLNADDARLKNVSGAARFKRIFFGFAAESDFMAQDVKFKDGGIEFEIARFGKIVLNCIGAHDASNALCAFSVGRLMGVSFEDARDALKCYKPMKGRLEFKRANGISLIDDTYNANPDSVKRAVDALMRLDVSGRRIVVLGDMLELGEKSRNLHREVGSYMAESGVDIVIASGSFAGDVIEGATALKGKMVTAYSASHAKGAASILKEISRSGDCALVKGSRRMKMEEVIECFTRPSTR